MFSGLGPSVSLGSAFLCDGLILEGRRSVDASYGGRGGLQCFRLVLWSAQQQRELFITVIVAPVLEGLSLAQLGSHGHCCQDRELFDWLGLGHVLPCGTRELSGVSRLSVC